MKVDLLNTRYQSFEAFMKDAIQTAQGRTSLSDVYRLKNVEVVSYLLAIIGLGWIVLSALVPMLFLSWFAFLGAIVLFLANPIGLLIVGAFGVAATSMMKILYEDKQFPIAVHQVGEHFRGRYLDVLNNSALEPAQKKEKIDGLFDSAVLMLILTPEEYHRRHPGQ